MLRNACKSATTTRALLVVLTATIAAGCHDDMYDQPRLDPLEQSDFFNDRRAARPLPSGTIAFGSSRGDDVRHTGRLDGQLAEKLPMPIDRALLERGRQRFNIYCSVCHARTGDGNGMIVERGYRQPPTFHSDRLRGAPVGHFFDVMTQGFGAMPSYASQVVVDDRWAIAAYIRTLQWSRYATVDDLSDDQRRKLEAAGKP